MIKYVNLREATELPCMHWGKKETPIFLVEELHNKTKKTHYMRESCFKKFKDKNSDIYSKSGEPPLMDEYYGQSSHCNSWWRRCN